MRVVSLLRLKFLLKVPASQAWTFQVTALLWGAASFPWRWETEGIPKSTNTTQ